MSCKHTTILHTLRKIPLLVQKMKLKETGSNNVPLEWQI